MYYSKNLDMYRIWGKLEVSLFFMLKFHWNNCMGASLCQSCMLL